MKKLKAMVFAGVVTAAFGAPGSLRAQNEFEGVITFKMDASQAGPGTMQYSVKGGKIRVDMSVEGMDIYTIFDAASKTMDMVMPMRQMYFESTMVNTAIADSAAAKTKLTWTGRKETIAGYECEHATATGEDGTPTDLCLAKGLGSFVWTGGGMRGAGRGPAVGSGWEDVVGKAFPLKVQEGDRVIMEATKVEKKTLDASLFTIPSGYQKMNMGMGMRGRGGH